MLAGWLCRCTRCFFGLPRVGCSHRRPCDSRQRGKPLGFFCNPTLSDSRPCLRKWRFAPLHFSEEFIRVGGEIGVLLLLFMGLEYSGGELKASLGRGLT